jgi:hypothetical protein
MLEEDIVSDKIRLEMWIRFMGLNMVKRRLHEL